MRYQYRCEECGHESEKNRSVEMRNLVFFCPACEVGLCKRQFTPTAMIAIPAHFRAKRGFHLPHKSDPAWETMVKEGRGRPKPKEPGLREEFEKAGLMRSG